MRIGKIQFKQNWYPASPFKPDQFLCFKTNSEILIFTQLEDSGQLKDILLQEAYDLYWIICNN